MANKPTDDFDDHRDDENWEEPVDDDAAFGNGTAPRATAKDEDDYEETEIDDADFVADDMNDIVDEADPLAEDAEYEEEAYDEDYLEDENAEDGALDGDEDGDSTFYPEDEQQQTEKKGFKASDLVFYGIIGAVVLVGGYLIYGSFFGGNSNAPQQVANPLQAQQQAPVQEPANGLVVPAQNAPQPVAAANNNDTSSLNVVGWQNNFTDQPELAAAAAQKPAPQPTSATTAPPVTQGSGQPVMSDPVLMQTIAEINARLADLSSKVTQVSSNSDANITRLEQTQKAAQAQMLDMQQRQSAAPVAAGQQPQVNPAAAAATQQEIASLKATIADLQKQVAQLSKSQESLTKDQKNLKDGQQSLKDGQDSLKQEQRRVAAAPAPAPVAATPKAETPKPAPKPVAKAEPKPVAKPAPAIITNSESEYQNRSPKSRPQQTQSTWVLRAATPGMAWVSPRPGSAELRRVVKGDTLEGIGTIRDIRQEAGRWLIEGTSGTVR